MSSLEQPALFPDYAPGMQEMQRALAAFVNEPALGRLAEAYNGEQLPTEPAERLAALQRISSDWDFRQMAERQGVDWKAAAASMTDEQRMAADGVGHALGMEETTAPENRFPDWLLLPGGANNAARDRLAIGLMTTSPSKLVALAAARRLSNTEKQNVAPWAHDAETEFDLSCAAFETMPPVRRTIFNDDGSTQVETSPGWQLIGEKTQERDGDPWRIRWYKIYHDGQWKDAYVIGAPQEINIGGQARRANSGDNFRCFADGVAKGAGTSLAIATTSIYAPMQHLTAVRELAPSGYTIETFGHGHEFNGVPRYSSHYAQEAKAAVDAAVALQAAITKRMTPSAA